MIEVIKSPQTTVNGHLSKWTAVHQPVTFEVQRKDAIVIYRNPIAGNLQRFKLSANVPSSILAGQNVLYVNGNVSKTLKVTAVSGVYLTVDWSDMTTILGGYINFTDGFKNYFLETNIINPILNVSLGISRNRVDSSGVAKVSVQEWLKQLAVYQNNFLYNEINKAVTNEGGKVVVQFRENYNGVTQAASSFYGIFYWVNGNKQILEIYGGNMGEFVPTLDATITNRAKFITDFEQPTYFRGFPFSLSFIYSDNLQNYQITRNEEKFNGAGTSQGSTVSNLSYNQRFAVNRLMLNGTYATGVESLDVWLENGAQLTINSVDGDTITTGVFNPPTTGEPAISSPGTWEEG